MLPGLGIFTKFHKNQELCLRQAKRVCSVSIVGLIQPNLFFRAAFLTVKCLRRIVRHPDGRLVQIAETQSWTIHLIRLLSRN